MTDQLHHLAAAYALDALDGEERRAFEKHFPTCEICSTDVAQYRETAAVLAEGAYVQPSPDLKRRVMADIAQTRQLSPLPSDSAIVDLGIERQRRRSTSSLLLATAAAALVAITGTIGVQQLRGRTSDFEEVVAAADSVVTDLQGDTGTVRVIWSRDRDQVAITADNLVDAGAGQAYALWFVMEGGVAPAGLFRPLDGKIREVLDVSDTDTTGWGITIEPDSGSPQPTGDILFLGTF